MKRTTVTACKGGFFVRLRIGGGRRQRFVIAVQNEPKARERAAHMAEMARQLVAAERATEALLILKRAGEQESDAEFESVAAFVRKLCGEQAPAAPQRRVPTFRELGVAWTRGELHKLYPDQVRLNKTAIDYHGRLSQHVYPLIGDKRLDEITLDDCEEVMRRIPESAKRSRQHIAMTMGRVLRIAVYPCRWIERSPLPTGFLPRANSRKAMAYIYPSEDALLLACVDVPYDYRLLWGFLVREGMRTSEALTLTWDCLDLAHGMVRLDANKTDDPRSWALDPGVARALIRHRELFAPNAAGADRVFSMWRPKGGLPTALRRHLRCAGVSRPELYASSASRMRIRAHDLRGTFVTLSIASGKTERWVMARTGHATSGMLSRYHRTAMSFAELNLGTLAPLDEAIPELHVGRKVGHEHRKPSESLAGTPVSTSPGPAKATSPPPGHGGASAGHKARTLSIVSASAALLSGR